MNRTAQGASPAIGCKAVRYPPEPAVDAGRTSGSGVNTFADPKPEKAPRRRRGRTLASQVYDPEAMFRCVMLERECRICGRPAATAHHIVPKGSPHYGDDVLENLAALCGSGTTGCHGLVESYDPVACAKLGRNLTAENIAYIHDLLGVDAGDAWLERRYHRTADA